MAVERWTPEGVVRFIESCRASGGLPLFKALIKGERFEVRGESAVLAVCFLGHVDEHEKSVLFYGVPEEDMLLILRERGEWRELLRKYGGR